MWPEDTARFVAALLAAIVFLFLQARFAPRVGHVRRADAGTQVIRVQSTDGGSDDSGSQVDPGGDDEDDIDLSRPIPVDC